MNHLGRFEHNAPGLLKSVLVVLRHPRTWRHRLKVTLTDRRTSEIFVLDEDEEALVDRMAEVINAAYALDISTNKVRIDHALDCIALSIQYRRKGNSEMWDYFNSLKPEDWIAWYRNLLPEDAL
jgi:hypothetical protein